MATPSSNDGGDSRTHGNAMSVEEAMGMDLHSDDEHTDEDEDEDDEGDGDKMQVLPPASPPRGGSSTMLPPKVPPRAAEPHVEGEDTMDVDALTNNLPSFEVPFCQGMILIITVYKYTSLVLMAV